MKILFLFIDQIRPDTLHQSQLLQELTSLGGTMYTNCHTPAPNTTRSLACLFSGLLPKFNGCDKPIKTPGFFFDPKMETIFHFLKNNDFQINAYHEPNEIDAGILPSEIKNYLSSDLQELSSLELKDKHFIWVGTTIHHTCMNRKGYSRTTLPFALNKATEFMKQLFESQAPDSFDHIFIFSDHGYLFNDEPRTTECYLSSRRTNILMFHREKKQKKYLTNSRFCSILSLMPTIKHIINKKEPQSGYDFSLFSKKERNYITLEDPVSYSPVVGNFNNMWGILGKHNLRTFDSASKMEMKEIERKILSKETDCFDNKGLSKKAENLEQQAVDRYKIMQQGARLLYPEIK